MELDVERGILPKARQLASPNHDDRPAGCAIDLVVVHGISLPPGMFGGDAVERLFTNTLDPDAHPYFRQIQDLRVSAHVLIRRDGELVQFVPFHKRAWHAGQSAWQGRECCNDFSVGIELEGADDAPYEDIQIQQLAETVHALCRAYPGFSSEQVVGHSDIALGRKTDPGPYFDWGHFPRPVGGFGRLGVAGLVLQRDGVDAIA